MPLPCAVATPVCILCVALSANALGVFALAPLLSCAAQQLRLYVGACALGSTARRWMAAPLAATIDEAPRFTLLGAEVLGDDVCLEYLLPEDEDEEP